MKWKLLSSEYLFRDRWFCVRKDRCETPAGKIIAPYYVYEFPDWVTAVPFTANNEVILVKQYRHALGETVIEIPGGCIDETDPSPEEAIKRELLEETGYRFTHIEPIGKISANPSTNNNLMHLFMARGGEKIATQQLDEGEDIEVILVTIPELKELLRKNQLMQSMHVTAILYALEKSGELHY